MEDNESQFEFTLQGRRYAIDIVVETPSHQARIPTLEELIEASSAALEDLEGALTDTHQDVSTELRNNGNSGTTTLTLPPRGNDVEETPIRQQGLNVVATDPYPQFQSLLTPARRATLTSQRQMPEIFSTPKPQGEVTPSPTGTETNKFNFDQPCCICLDVPDVIEFSYLDGCNHTFCFDCIEQWADQENTCPLCKVRFTKITRVRKLTSAEHENGGEENIELQSICSSKKVSNRNQGAGDSQVEDENQYSVYASVFFRRLEREIRAIQGLIGHYCNNENEIKNLIEQSRRYVKREIENPDEFFKRILDGNDVTQAIELEKVAITAHYRSNERKIKALIERSHSIEREIMESHVPIQGYTSVDLFFRRLEREKQALTEHYTNNEREIRALLELSCSIESEITTRHGQADVLDQEHMNKLGVETLENMIDHYRDNETKIFALIECSCNIESEIEAFIEYLDNSMRSSVFQQINDVTLRGETALMASLIRDDNAAPSVPDGVDTATRTFDGSTAETAIIIDDGDDTTAS